MTLIVARKVQNSIFIVGDTKLTNDKTKEKISVSKGVIKTKLLSDHIAVSFAGNEHIADEALRAVAGEDDLDVIARMLLAHHVSVEDEHTADFVLASQKPAVDLVMIRARKIEDATSAWIGDAPAFELFRAYETRHRQPAQQVPNAALLSIEQVSDRTGDTPAGIETYSNMLRCMKHVIDDEVATGVGGFAIPVLGSSGVFTYMSHAAVSTHPLIFEEGQNIIPFGTAEQGGYGYDVVGTGDHRGLSSYFLQGRLGIIYREEDGGLLRPQVIRDVSPIEFEEVGSKLIGATVATYYADNRILCQRALDRFASGDVDGSLADANRAIERGGQHSDAWKCRGMILSKMGTEDQAILDFERAVQVSPQDPDAWNKLGISRRALGDSTGAIAAFSEAIDRDPSFWRARANRATSYWAANQFDAALVDITEALALQPANATLWRSRAATHLRLGMKSDALFCVDKALEICPQDAELLKARQDLQAELRLS